MKKQLFFLMTFSVQIFSWGQGEWHQHLDLAGSARYGAAGFSLYSPDEGYNVIYIGTGYHNGYLNDFWSANDAHQAWTQKANFAGSARSRAVGFAVNGKGYIATGYDGSRKNDMYEYDPDDNDWTQKANFGGAARMDAVGFGIGSKGYVGTGWTTSGAVKDFYEYNPSNNTWTSKADFGGTSRSGAVGFSIGEKGYIGTGFDINYSFKKDFYEYNPSNNTWTSKTDFGGAARSEAAGCGTSQFGYIAFGDQYGSTFYTDIYEYSQSANTWTQKTSFSGQNRMRPVSVSLDDVPFFLTGQNAVSNGMGGYTYTDLKDVWAYYRTSTSKSPFPGYQRGDGFGIGNGCIVNGKIYFGTGYDYHGNHGFLDDWWEYNPSNNTWTQKANTTVAKRNAAAFSVNNYAYLGAGQTTGYVATSSFYKYDPTGNAWTPVESMPVTKGSAKAIVINDIAYVYGTDNLSFYAYDYSDDEWVQKDDMPYYFTIMSDGTDCYAHAYVSGTFELYEYDPSSDDWTYKLDIPDAGHLFTVGSRFMWETSYQNIFEYLPASNTIVQKASVPFYCDDENIFFSSSDRSYYLDAAESSTKPLWEYIPEP